jgi:hypothetical protein
MNELSKTLNVTIHQDLAVFIRLDCNEYPPYYNNCPLDQGKLTKNFLQNSFEAGYKHRPSDISDNSDGLGRPLRGLKQSELSKSVNNPTSKGEIEQKIIEFQDSLNSDSPNFS